MKRQRKSPTEQGEVKNQTEIFEDVNTFNEAVSKAIGEGKLLMALQQEAVKPAKSLLAIHPSTELDRPRYYTIYGTPFIGRERDIEDILNKFQYTQLLTLVGLPGVGKTELASQVEIEAKTRRYFTHTCFISLQDVRGVDEVLQKIKNQLQSIRPRKRTLLILDNCELIENINSMRIKLYSLLNKNKQLTILATSRVQLSVEEYEVAPLAVPRSANEPLETLRTYDAIKLFIEIAKHHDETFTLTDNDAKTIANLSIALIGLPLAIMIVASSIKKLGLAKLSEMVLSKLPELESLENIPTELLKATDTQILFFLYLLNKTLIISPPMAGIEGGGEKQQPGAIEISPAMLLDQRLEKAGAYKRLRQFDPRRATLLQTYLTTEKSAADVGKEVGVKNRTQAYQLIHSAMELAFFTLPEQERAEYDNNPAVALRTSASQKTHTKGEKIKEALDRRRNPQTGKVEFSTTHKQNIAEANQRRGQAYREGTYTGKPIGRPRKNATT